MCGRLDVDEMLSELTPQQWDEWEAFDLLEPIGDRGIRELLAFMCAKDTERKVYDFLRDNEQPQEPEQTPEDQRAALRRAAETNRGGSR